MNRTYGQLQPTLPHTAAERNDTELARLVSAAKPDLTIRDKEYDATPPDRAAFFKRSEIIKLIKK